MALNRATCCIALFLVPCAAKDAWDNGFDAGYETGFDEGAAAALAKPQGGPQTTLYYPGYNNRTCFRVPVLLTVNSTIFAFAEARTGVACFNDDCNPLQPVAGDGRTAVVLRTSTDGGVSWSSMADLCLDGKGPHGCGDYAVVYDAVRERIVLQYAQYDATLEDTLPRDRTKWPAHVVFERTSSDMGRSWSAPVNRNGALAAVTEGCHPYCDLIVGPGKGLQLQSNTHGKKGRLLFCGHRTDPDVNRISPIWSSDDGATYKLRAVLPHGTPGTMGLFGPDECQLAELSNGSVMYNGRNNWVPDSWNRSQPLPYNRSQHRIVTRSDDGGDTWLPIRFDATLSDHSHGCEASLLAHPAPSDTLFFSQPLTPSRNIMTVHRSDDGGGSWPHYMVVATGGASYSSMSTVPDSAAVAHGRHAGRGAGQVLGLLYERDGPLCTTLTVACRIVFTTFPTDF